MKFCAAACAPSAFSPRRKPRHASAMDLGPHASFIVAAYAAAAIVVSALVLWIFADYRGLERSIAELEARGTKRRSLIDS
jgi:heme exporter protein D